MIDAKAISCLKKLVKVWLDTDLITTNQYHLIMQDIETFIRIETQK